MQTNHETTYHARLENNSRMKSDYEMKSACCLGLLELKVNCVQPFELGCGTVCHISIQINYKMTHHRWNSKNCVIK